MSGKYHAYPEYKNSGAELLEEIPTHWVATGLKRYCNVTDGSHHSPSIQAEGFPFISVTDVGENMIDFVNCKRITKSDYLRLSKEGCKPKVGDVLLTKDGTIGRATIVRDEDDDFVILSSLGLLSPSKQLNNVFLYYYLVSGINVDQMNSMIHGSALKRMTINKIDSLKITFPDIEEQQKIANFLDHVTAKIDTLIAKQEKLIELLKEKRQAVISHAVTRGLNPNALMKDSGVEWLGDVPEHWTQKVKIANVSETNRGSFVNGPFGSDLLSNELKDKGVPVIYIRDINRTGYKRKSTVCVTEVKAEQLDVCKVVSGDVLISKVGDPPGDSCIYPAGEPDAIITQDVIRIRVERSKFNPRYISKLLNSNFGQTVLNDISVEGTRKRVSLGDFKATRFIIPTLEEQNSIVDYIEDNNKKMDSLIKMGLKAISLMKERKTALISAAVTGKIDVRDWQE
jgi:type I restriction enzyme S subunit